VLPARRTNADQGFTLVELLVVVVVIGVLMSIAIPVYLHFSKGAYEATAKSDLHILRLEERAYDVSRTGFATTSQLASANPKLRLSPGSVAAVVWSSPDGFCVGATNTKAPKDPAAPFAAYGFPYRTFFFDSLSGEVTTTMCATPSGATGIDGHYLDESGLH
jgi:type IV pilus assembly protein PilA